MKAGAGWLAAGALLAGVGCPQNQARPPETGTGGPGAAAARADVRVTPGHPPVAVVTREGDPYPALGVAVVTSGLLPAGEASLALSALTAIRLAASPDVTVVPAFDGYRIRVPLRQGQAPVPAWDAVRAALLAPVRDGEIAAVQARLDRSVRIADPGVAPVWSCKNEPFVLAPPSPVSTAGLEASRRAAHGSARITVGVVGPRSTTEAVAAQILAGEPWPAAARAAAAPPWSETAAVGASPEPRAVRVSIALWTPRATQAAAAASLLDRGTLGARLGLLDAPARLRDIAAVAHPLGGCVAVDVDLSPGDLGEHGVERIAAAAALVEEDVAFEVAQGDEREATSIARQGRDPAEAAERAAWWAASVDGAPPAAPYTLVSEPGPRIKKEELDLAMKRARAELAATVIEKRMKSEPGQGEMWLLLGSPCGTGAESLHDAGFAATAVHAAARHEKDDVEIAPWVTPDGVGVLVHGPRRTTESAEAHARRVADAAGRAIAMLGRDPGQLEAAHTSLFRASELDTARAFTQLALALSPGHPAWVQPFGSSDALGRASPATLGARARALLSGPVRLAVLGEGDGQMDAAARAVDRWLVRRPGETRTCAKDLAPKPKPGTYAVERVTGGPAEVLVAAPLPAATDPHVASLLAAALDGDDGPLAVALATSVREWSVRVVGRRDSLAIVVRVSGPNQALDAAVGKVRAVLAKAKTLDPQDLVRAQKVRLRARELELRDPARRVASLFLGDLEDRAKAATDGALRGIADEAFKDEGLVLVALRPPAERRAAP